MNNQEVCLAVFHRARQIKEKKARQRKMAITMVCSLLLVIGLSVAVPVLLFDKAVEPMEGTTSVASMLSLTPWVGYVVVGVLGLIVGVVAAFLCWRWREKSEKR